MAFLANLAPFLPVLAFGVLYAVGHHRYGRPV